MLIGQTEKMNNDYISVKEYAQLKGVSPQSVYKQLSTKLATYVVMVENRKMLKKEVLETLENKGVEAQFNQVDNQVDNQVEKLSTNFNSEELIRINQRNEKIIDELRAQIEEKDKQIKEQSQHIIELSDRVATLFENSQKIEFSYQLLLNEKNQDNDIENEDISARAIDEAEEIKPEKKGFFRRLFNI